MPILSSLLARSATRQKEMAIRAALGAGRGRLLRQMLTQTLVLSCCGAALGIAVAFAGTRALAHLDAVSIPLLQSARLDPTALVFTVVMALVAGLAFGMAPALQGAVPAPQESLKGSARGSSEPRGRKWIRNLLVVSEITFACVLLVGAGLLMRSLLRVLDVDMGFRPEQTAAMRVDPGRTARHAGGAERLLRRRVAARSRGSRHRGCRIDRCASTRPESQLGHTGQGQGLRAWAKPNAFVRVVSDGYMAAMGIRVLAGRELSAADRAGSEPVVLINETMAQRLWPGEDAIGTIIRPDRGAAMSA